MNKTNIRRLMNEDRRKNMKDIITKILLIIMFIGILCFIVFSLFYFKIKNYLDKIVKKIEEI